MQKLGSIVQYDLQFGLGSRSLSLFVALTCRVMRRVIYESHDCDVDEAFLEIDYNSRWIFIKKKWIDGEKKMTQLV